MSTFVTLWHDELSSKVVLPTPAYSEPSTPSSPTPAFAASDVRSTEALRSYFFGLHPPRSRKQSQDGLMNAQRLSYGNALVRPGTRSEDEALWVAIAAKLTVGLYTQFLETYLDEASETETELGWWNHVERSRWRTTYFLLQTFPLRVLNLSNTIVRRVRSQNIPLRLSLFTPASLRELFPSRSSLRPNTLIIALFPHLRHQPYSSSATVHHYSTGVTHFDSVFRRILSLPIEFWNRALELVTLPIHLARNECTYKRKELENIRDERAAKLGELLTLRDHLNNALESQSSGEIRNALVAFCMQCTFVLSPDAQQLSGDLTDLLDTLTNTVLPAHTAQHALHVHAHGLRRPSRLTLLWPKLLFLPPLGLYAAKLAYHSRDSLEQVARDAWATVCGFWNDWLLGPLRDVVRTVRAGGDEGIIVTKESVKADLDSLERMAVALAKEKLNYTPEQMAVLTQQLRAGDLTPVMQIYEDDIKSPLRSAVGGSLLRTLFIQVQKAKVDIDQALSGIDKLLKSQELTFAFVGVAPSLAVVYAVIGYLRNLWSGSKGNGRYGGREQRTGTWLAVRRIERLLIADTSSSPSRTSSSSIATAATAQSQAPTPRTAGLLLLSTTQLRKYACTHLPLHSRLRDGFLADVSDLEDPSLGRVEKLRVVERMWRSWGGALGWGAVGNFGS